MAETTEDALLGGKVKFLQPASGYRAAIDPVLLAASLPVGPGDAVLDAGCGAGAAFLCLAARVESCRVVGLDVQADLVTVAQRNIVANGWHHRLDAVAADLGAIPPPYVGMAFDAVMTNPPFVGAGSGTAPPDAVKDRANVESSLDLDGWLGACLRRLRPKGWLALIHRADRLDDALAALAGQLGGIVVVPLWPKHGRPAKRVIVLGRKGSSAPLVLTPGLVLHEEDGRYTAEAAAILRGGAPLGVPGCPTLC